MKNNEAEPTRLNRRDAIKWMLTAAGGVLMSDGTAIASAASPAKPATALGYGTDPVLTKIYAPGDLWPLTLNPAQRQTAVALCDCIIPADDHSPSASAVGVPDFIDEWVSAPYPEQRKDRDTILKGLEWINAESQRRFNVSFADAKPEQQTALCQDICYEPNAQPAFKEAARFFKRYRDLTAGGFYTTPEGSRDIGYVGNVPSATFEGPPADLIKKMGLD